MRAPEVDPGWGYKDPTVMPPPKPDNPNSPEGKAWQRQQDIWLKRNPDVWNPWGITPTPDIPSTKKNDDKTTTTSNNNTTTTSSKRTIKIATSNLFADLNPTIAPELMTRRIFEEIGGMELLEVSRTDTIDGLNQEYSPIYNLADLNTQYDPNVLISFQGVDKDYFQSLEISLDEHIPDYGTGPDGSIVYIDQDITSPTYNSLIINTVRVQDWERVEVDFLTYNVSLNDTIIET
jgi:hypothetical protein